MKIGFLNGYVNGKNNKALLESEPNPPALRFPIFWKVLEQQLNREDPESGRSSFEQLSCVLFWSCLHVDPSVWAVWKDEDDELSNLSIYGDGWTPMNRYIFGRNIQKSNLFWFTSVPGLDCPAGSKIWENKLQFFDPTSETKNLGTTMDTPTPREFNICTSSKMVETSETEEHIWKYDKSMSAGAVQFCRNASLCGFRKSGSIVRPVGEGVWADHLSKIPSELPYVAMFDSGRVTGNA